MNGTVVPLAHGLGGRSDLPVPLWIAVYGAVAALLVSFAALSFFWKDPKFTADAGKPLPSGPARALAAPGWEVLWRLVGLVGFALLLTTAWFGTNEVASNPAPNWFYIWLWVGLVPVSALFGPAIRAISPLRTVAAGLSGIWRGRERVLPEHWGMFPAAVSLFSFVWLELVFPDASLPRTVAVYLTLYAAVHITMGLIYGPEWFEKAEGFEVYSSLVGRLAPIARTQDGSWTVRNPLRGLSLTPPLPGLVAVVAVLLGSTAFDGVTRTPYWRDFTASKDGFAYLASGTAGLVASILVVWGIYWVAVRMTRAWLPDRADLMADFAPSLVPIAIGYTIAHYFSFALFDGQLGWTLASDPFGQGWNLFGAADGTINYGLISVGGIALIQVAAIAVGHVAGVVVAHDKAISLFAKRHHLMAQYPLLCAMVAFTMTGIALIVGNRNSLWLLITVGVFMPVAATFVWILAPVEEFEAESMAS
ncbi:MAG: hypothetical protein ACRCYU_11650 [Nocardioides sp.]